MISVEMDFSTVGGNSPAEFPKSQPAVEFQLLPPPQFTHEEKERIRTRTRNAVMRGALKREPCVVCGEARVEAHHIDYSKPLEVLWLCEDCHCSFHIDSRINPLPINQQCRRCKAEKPYTKFPAGREGYRLGKVCTDCLAAKITLQKCGKCHKQKPVERFETGDSLCRMCRSERTKVERESRERAERKRQKAEALSAAIRNGELKGRTCCDCKVLKPLTSFSSNGSRGRKPFCNACHYVRQRDTRLARAKARRERLSLAAQKSPQAFTETLEAQTRETRSQNLIPPSIPAMTSKGRDGDRAIRQAPSPRQLAFRLDGPGSVTAELS